MTKPSYEELERLDAELHHHIDGRIADDPDALLSAQDAWKLRDVIAENLRVRGLLQRYGVHKADCGTWDVTYGDRENKELMAKACDCGLTAELIPSGAESADIGKLNTADKKIDGRGDDVVIGAESNVVDLIAPPLRNERPSTVQEGSAETGGEKA